MAKDIRDLSMWHQKMTEFNNFAKLHDAEFRFRTLPEGKELITVGLYFRPMKKERKNDIVSQETRS